MNRIEKGLHDHHATMQATQAPKEEATTSQSTPSAESQSEAVVETPFAKVNSVESGSPANEAGVKAGDKIRSFGSANWTNHESLRKVGDVVQRNEGVRHIVQRLSLFLTDNISGLYWSRFCENAKNFSFV